MDRIMITQILIIFVLFFFRTILSEHVRSKHEGITPYECDKCDRTFGKITTLKNHIRNVHSRVKCDICSQDICNSFILKRHKATVHGVKPSDAISCDYCPMFFEIEGVYHKHMAKHHPEMTMKTLNQT